jgi:hypothetical protein
MVPELSPEEVGKALAGGGDDDPVLRTQHVAGVESPDQTRRALGAVVGRGGRQVR